MPIRINLLAEQQAADEARRRDPVKRAIWAAGAVVALVLIWILVLQIKVIRAKSELGAQQAGFKQIEPGYLQVSNSYRDISLIQKRLDSLQKHATNRFLWSHLLHALQFATDEKVRIVSLTGTSVSTEQKQINEAKQLFFDFPKRIWPLPPGPLKTNVEEVARATLGAITNKTNFVRYQSELISTLTISTSRIEHLFGLVHLLFQVAANVEVVKPETVTEKITLTIRARDYSKPPGSRVDASYTNFVSAPYFRRFLNRTNSTVQAEIKPREDESDKINPTDPYIQFTVQCGFPEWIRSNE